MLIEKLEEILCRPLNKLEVVLVNKWRIVFDDDYILESLPDSIIDLSDLNSILFSKKNIIQKKHSQGKKDYIKSALDSGGEYHSQNPSYVNIKSPALISFLQSLE